MPDEEASGCPSGANRIVVGEALEEAAQKIVADGGQDFSRFVGIIDYPRMARWFILKDGTCLQVTPVVTEVGGRDVVGRLTVGEPGRGYENWERQRRRDIKHIDLR